MFLTRRSVVVLLATAPVLGACSAGRERRAERQQANAFADFNPPLYPNETQELRQQINKWADHYEIPRELVHKVCIRESTHRPWAVNRPYYGLLQILPATARSMGYKGNAQGLLDAETNLGPREGHAPWK